jgi:hypothetical protein
MSERRETVDIREEIAKVAYELYEKRGRAEGHHVEDWLEAEKIVTARHGGKKERGLKRAATARRKTSEKTAKERKSKGSPKTTPKKRAATRKRSAEKAP